MSRCVLSGYKAFFEIVVFSNRLKEMLKSAMAVFFVPLLVYEVDNKSALTHVLFKVALFTGWVEDDRIFFVKKRSQTMCAIHAHLPSQSE